MANASANASARRARRIPGGLLGAILLGLLVEGFVDRRRSEFMVAHELDWRAAGRDAHGPAVRDAEVLLLGDSMVKFGLNPWLLEAHTGRRSYGLALLNGRPGASYFLLRRAIESGARPRLVVVDYQPECMIEATPHNLDQRNWKGLLSVRECVDLSVSLRDPLFLARSTLACLLPSYACRGEIRRTVMAALRDEPSPNADENARVGRNRVANRGGMVLPPTPGYRGDVPPKVMETVAKPDWFHRPDNVIYIRRLLRLADAHGIRVVWLLPPNVPAVQARRDAVGLSGRYERFVRGVQARYPNVDVIDGRASGYGPDLFVDAVHLDRRGAANLSRGVSAILRDWLDRPAESGRWAVLGPPTPLADADALALEDVDRSRAALIAAEDPAVLRR